MWKLLYNSILTSLEGIRRTDIRHLPFYHLVWDFSTWKSYKKTTDPQTSRAREMETYTRPSMAWKKSHGDSGKLTQVKAVKNMGEFRE